MKEKTEGLSVIISGLDSSYVYKLFVSTCPEHYGGFSTEGRVRNIGSNSELITIFVTKSQHFPKTGKSPFCPKNKLPLCQDSLFNLSIHASRLVYHDIDNAIERQSMQKT